MRFFYVVGIVLGAIALLNIIQISVEYAIKDSVYACSELSKYAPLDVQKKCRRYK
jgi:hypothetical protein